MTSGTPETRAAVLRAPRWEWPLRVLVVVTVALALGLFALVDVIDGSGGEAGHTAWMDRALDREPSMFLVFFGAPIVAGVAVSWGLRRRGARLAASLVAGLLVVVAYLYALVVLGTGLGPFDVGP